MKKDDPAPFASQRRFDDDAVAELIVKLPVPHLIDPRSVVARVRHLASVYLDQHQLEEAADHASKIVRKLDALRESIARIRQYAGRPNKSAREKKQLLVAMTRARDRFIEVLNDRPDICHELGFDDPTMMLMCDTDIATTLGALGDATGSDAELKALQDYLTTAIASIEGRRGSKRSTWHSRAERRFVTALAMLFGTATGSPATGTTSPEDGSMVSNFYLFLEAIFWHVDRSEPPSRQVIQRAVKKARLRTLVKLT